VKYDIRERPLVEPLMYPPGVAIRASPFAPGDGIPGKKAGDAPIDFGFRHFYFSLISILSICSSIFVFSSCISMANLRIRSSVPFKIACSLRNSSSLCGIIFPRIHTGGALFRLPYNLPFWIIGYIAGAPKQSYRRGIIFFKFEIAGRNTILVFTDEIEHLHLFPPLFQGATN
jgi:hypothetical protein